MSESEQARDAAAGLRWEVRGAVAVLTLDRPAAMNSFDLGLMERHRERLEQFADDDALRVLIYTGSGRAFSTGIDIKKAPEFLELAPEVRTRYWVTPNALGIGKPSIAAINGHALGGGCELALGCDIRIAAEGARLGLPEARLGAIPGGGATQWLPRLVGLGDALLMMLTGEPVAAAEALRIGLVQRVVPGERLLEEALRIAEAIAANGKSAVRLIKEAAMLGLNLPVREALWLEEVYFARNREAARDEIAERLRRFQERSAARRRD